MSLYGIKDSSNITLISNKTQKQVLYSKSANKTDISFSSSPVYALKKGVKSISWDTQREGQCVMSMQVFDLQWIALLMGSEFKPVTAEDKIASRKMVTVANATGTFTGNIVSGSLTVFKLENDNVTHTTEYTVTTEPTVAANKYKISSATVGDVTTNTITFATGESGNFVCYFLEVAKNTSKKFKVEVDKYPSGYSLFLDTTIKADGSGVEEMVQIKMGNVKPQSNMNLTFDAENVATLDVTFDILSTSDNTMLEFTTL